jgi:uncharacterized protein (TIGR00661 family)
MARILYAVQGDGLGHATRAHSVAAGLIRRGHEVRFLSSLKGTRYLREYFPDSVTDIFGFRLNYDHGRIRRLETVMDVARGLVRHIRPTLRRVKRVFREHRPDLLITDAEWFAPTVARSLRVPFVSLDNQHMLTHCAIDRPPGFARDYLNAYAVVRLYHTGARRYLISSFFTAPIRHQPATLVPPILRREIYARKVEHGDYWVAYLGGSGAHDRMRRVLEAYTDVEIRAYGFGTVGRQGRVTYKPMSADGFLDDLSGCAAVVSSAGHTLIGECHYLDKPMLLVPFAGQFEQRLNAHYVTRMGTGCWVDRLTGMAMSDFAERIETYRSVMRERPKPTLEPVLDAVERELPYKKTWD